MYTGQQNKPSIFGSTPAAGTGTGTGFGAFGTNTQQQQQQQPGQQQGGGLFGGGGGDRLIDDKHGTKSAGRRENHPLDSGNCLRSLTARTRFPE